MNEGKIKIIIDYIKGRVGTDFQIDLNKILYEYWQSQQHLFEAVSWFGGDQKNDGWVKDLSLFYQIYAPVHLSESFKKDNQKKFSQDLNRLAEKVFIDNLWGGNILEYIYIVNDKGLGLSEDSNDFYQNEIDKINLRYNKKINYKIFTINELHDLLYEIKDTYHMDRLLSKLNLNQNLVVATTTSADIIDFVNNVANNIGDVFSNGIQREYSRISTDKKLEINKFNIHYESIRSNLSKLVVVDKAFKEINSDIMSSSKFESVKNYFITEYKRLSTRYEGDVLYEEMLRITHDITNNSPAYFKAGELVIIYIFDRCDIFLKEEENDITK